MSTIEQRVIQHICEQIGSKPHEINTEHELVADLGFDSLDGTELMMALEAEFDCRLEDDTFLSLTTVQQVIDHLRAQHAVETEGGAA